jgi:DNA-binding transcriptional ArsR family regulator
VTIAGKAITAGDADIATVAALLADPARAAILVALADGRALPAGELARAACVAASTASAHLAKMSGAGLLDVEKHGKHRYYRLAGAHVVRLVEQLAMVAPRKQVASLRGARSAADLAFARSCYDHLAGSLAVALTAQLVADGTLIAIPDGYDFDWTRGKLLRRIGIDEAVVSARGRQLARPCLDWTARRHHVAGALGAAILASLLEQCWLRRKPESRALAVTELGSAQLESILGMQLSDLAATSS